MGGPGKGFQKSPSTRGTWKSVGPEVPPALEERDLVPLERGETRGCREEQKSVQLFLRLPEASQVPRSECIEPARTAVSRRQEGNPTLINLLANEAH